MTDAATHGDGNRGHLYAELAAAGPYGADLGHALITRVKPHADR